ncbi:MAG: zinc ribbon domain-containing protein, partial [Chloroflexi bacterium]
MHQSARLHEAYRLTPAITRLPFTDNRLALGLLESKRPLRVLLGLAVHARNIGPLRALRMEADAELLDAARMRERVDGEVVVEVVAKADHDGSVPHEIEEALAHIAMFKVHEKAQADLARGDHARATTRLRNLATQLLNAGEIELARAALLEAGALMRTGQMSAEGRTSASATAHAVCRQTLRNRLPKMIRCNACGAVHPANTVYCDECGNRLSQDRKVTTAIFSDRPQNERPLTVGFSTPDGARHFELVLDTQAFIGRTDDATGARPEVSLDLLAGKSEGVSRRHARLLRQGTRV